MSLGFLTKKPSTSFRVTMYKNSSNANGAVMTTARRTRIQNSALSDSTNRNA